MLEVHRPELLNIAHISEVKNIYSQNSKVLGRVLENVLNGTQEELLRACPESYHNRVLAEYVVQQEYIRHRESQNWR